MDRDSDEYDLDDISQAGGASGRATKHWIIRRFTPNKLALLVSLCVFLGWLLSDPVEHFGPRVIVDVSKPPDKVPLPHVYAMLQQLAYKRFDNAAHVGRVNYDHGNGELFSLNGFNWHFVTSPVIGSVPSSPVYAEDLSRVGDTHFIYLDQRAPYRPTMLLEPLKPEASTEDITPEDILAAAAVLRAFDPVMIMAVSIGGNAADTKQNKVMRIFAMPEGFDLWPNHATSDWKPSTRIDHIPFRHFVLRVDPRQPGKDLMRSFHRVLAECKKAIVHDENLRGFGYTMMMTKHWVAAIPRSHSGPPPDSKPSLPEVMLGMVSVGSDEERHSWEDMAYEQTLRNMGLHFDD